MKAVDGGNPDQYAQSVTLARQMNMPPDVVAADPATYQARARLAQYRDMLGVNTPATSQFLAQPVNAKLAADDVESLSTTERLMRGASDIALRAPAGGFLQTFGSGLKGLGDTVDAGVRLIDRGVRSAFGDGVADAFWFDGPEWANPATDLRAAGQPIKYLSNRVAPPVERQNLATDIGSGLGQVAGQMATMLLSHGVGAGLMFGQGADQQAERVAEKGATGAAADAAIIGGGAVTAITEKFGLDMLLHRVPPAIKNKVLGKLADVALAGCAEAVQEVTEGIMHNVLSQAAFDPDQKIFEGLDRDALAAGGTGAIARGLVNLAVRGRSHGQAVTDAQKIEALADAAGQSKLRERAPDTHAELVQAQAEQAGVETVYVDAEALTRYFQSVAVDPATAAEGGFATLPPQLRRLEPDLATALASGGDVAIPMGDLLTYLPADAIKALAPDMRLRPNGSSVNDNLLEEIRTRLAEDAKAQEAEQAAQASADRVADDLRTQLLGAGRTETQANAEAQLAAAHYRTRAENLGLDAWNLYQERGVAVRRGDERTLKQDGGMVLRQPVNDGVDLDREMTVVQVPKVAIENDTVERKAAKDARKGQAPLDLENSDLPGVKIHLSGGDWLHAISSWKKSVDATGIATAALAHLDATRVLPKLFRTSALVESHVDRKGDPAVEKIHRFFAAMSHGEERYAVKMTVEEHRAGRQVLIIDGIERLDKLHDMHLAKKMPAEGMRGGTPDAGASLPPIQTYPPLERTGIVRTGNTVILRDLIRGIKDEDGKVYLQPDGGSLPLRGSVTFGDGQAIIRLFAKADSSTIMHELGHVWLEETLDDADLRADAPQAVKTLARHVREWLGLAEGERPSENQHEQFARGFEAYLREGRAPTDGLRGAFAQFRRWLTRLYRNIRRLNVELSDDARSVFDRMLATETEIQTETEAERQAQTSADRVADDLRTQLLDAGRTETQANTEAQLAAAHYRTRAENLGLDAFALYQERGVAVRRGDERTLKQDGALYQKNHPPIAKLVGDEFGPQGSDIEVRVMPLVLTMNRICDVPQNQARHLAVTYILPELVTKRHFLAVETRTK